MTIYFIIGPFVNTLWRSILSIPCAVQFSESSRWWSILGSACFVGNRCALRSTTAKTSNHRSNCWRRWLFALKQEQQVVRTAWESIYIAISIPITRCTCVFHISYFWTPPHLSVYTILVSGVHRTVPPIPTPFCDTTEQWPTLCTVFVLSRIFFSNLYSRFDPNVYVCIEMGETVHEKWMMWI